MSAFRQSVCDGLGPPRRWRRRRPRTRARVRGSECAGSRTRGSGSRSVGRRRCPCGRAGKGLGSAHPSPLSINRSPESSTRKRHSGGTTVVAPSRSTLAGPAWEAPAGSRPQREHRGVEEPAAEEHGPRLDPGAGEVSRHAPRAERGLCCSGRSRSAGSSPPRSRRRCDARNAVRGCRGMRPPAPPRKLMQQGFLDVVALVDAKPLHLHTYRSRGACAHETAVATGTSSSIMRPFTLSTTEISYPLCKFIQNAGPVPR